MREERKKVWLTDFQTRLLMRIGAYWFIYMVTLMNLLFVWRLVTEGSGDLLEQFIRFLGDYYPALIVSVLLLPSVAWDVLKFTHRLVGPVVRFRANIRELAAGRPVHPIKLREGDFLVEMRDEFNALLEVLQRLGVPALKPANPADEGQKRHTA